MTTHNPRGYRWGRGLQFALPSRDTVAAIAGVLYRSPMSSYVSGCIAGAMPFGLDFYTLLMPVYGWNVAD